MFKELLQERLNGVVCLSESQLDALEGHFELLQRWNRVVNLTSIGKVEEVVERHYAESIFAGAQLPAGAFSVCDVGSGAGFPGFPVAVLRPECEVTLIEAHQRKAVFLKDASRRVRNVRILAKRAERVEEEFEWAVSRAVAYSDMRRWLGRLSRHAALLVGDVEVAGMPEFEWDAPIPVPWGGNRYLLVGSRV